MAQNELTFLKLFGNLSSTLLKLNFPDSVLLFGLYAENTILKLERISNGMTIGTKIYSNNICILRTRDAYVNVVH
jgi:hypothetical protein